MAHLKVPLAVRTVATCTKQLEPGCTLTILAVGHDHLQRSPPSLSKIKSHTFKDHWG